MPAKLIGLQTVPVTAMWPLIRFSGGCPIGYVCMYVCMYVSMYESIVFTSYFLFQLPFCVIADHERESIVVAVRGSISLRDIFTDLTAGSEKFEADGTSLVQYGDWQSVLIPLSVFHQMEQVFHPGYTGPFSYIWKPHTMSSFFRQFVSLQPFPPWTLDRDEAHFSSGALYRWALQQRNLKFPFSLILEE